MASSSSSSTSFVDFSPLDVSELTISEAPFKRHLSHSSSISSLNTTTTSSKASSRRESKTVRFHEFTSCTYYDSDAASTHVSPRPVVAPRPPMPSRRSTSSIASFRNSWSRILSSRRAFPPDADASEPPSSDDADYHVDDDGSDDIAPDDLTSASTKRSRKALTVRQPLRETPGPVFPRASFKTPVYAAAHVAATPATPSPTLQRGDWNDLLTYAHA